MKAKIVDIKGKEAGEIELNDTIFAKKWNEELVHQALVTVRANARRPWAHVKDRSEVRGGGKKPWKQKGTGRARHGSIRSPLWTGGGVTFGPRKEKDYSKKMNKKMMRVAIHSVLSKKLAEGELQFVDSIEVESAKTKDLVGILTGFFKTKTAPSTLLVSAKENNTLVRPAGNIVKVSTIHGDSVGIYDLLTHKNILVESKAAEEIK